jgi:hypothetical protein
MQTVHCTQSKLHSHSHTYSVTPTIFHDNQTLRLFVYTQQAKSFKEEEDQGKVILVAGKGSKRIERCFHFTPETHTKRQATQHDCLPSLLGDGDEGSAIVYGEDKIFCTGPTRAAKPEQRSLVPVRKAQRNNQGRTPFICTL